MDLYTDGEQRAGLADVITWWNHHYPADVFVTEPRLVVEVREKMNELVEASDILKGLQASLGVHGPSRGDVMNLPDTDSPVLLAEPFGESQWRAWCPFCKHYHYHGASEGHRTAHCFDSHSPFEETGYYLVLASEVPEEDDDGGDA